MLSAGVIESSQYTVRPPASIGQSSPTVRRRSTRPPISRARTTTLVPPSRGTGPFGGVICGRSGRSELMMPVPRRTPSHRPCTFRGWCCTNCTCRDRRRPSALARRSSSARSHWPGRRRRFRDRWRHRDASPPCRSESAAPSAVGDCASEGASRTQMTRLRTRTVLRMHHLTLNRGRPISSFMAFVSFMSFVSFT